MSLLYKYFVKKLLLWNYNNNFLTNKDNNENNNLNKKNKVHFTIII